MKSLSLTIVVLIAMSMSTSAQVPRTISFQGVLTDASGTLVPDGNHTLTLKLYDNVASPTAIFIEAQTVPVVKGVFNVIIGSVTALPASLMFDRAYFLGVAVDGGLELAPRTALTAAPYALRAERANVAEALAPNATGVVTSVNNQSGALTMQGGGGTTVTNVGNAFTISSVGGGGTGIQGVQSTDGTLAIQNPNGPIATIGIPDGAIKVQKINAQGAFPGQAIVYSGSQVEWQTVSGSIQQLQNTDAALTIQNPTGPKATINVASAGISSGMIAEDAVTSGKIRDGHVQTNDIGDAAVTGSKIATGHVVKSINTLTDDVSLLAGNNITITPTGNTLTIASGGGATYWSANGNDISSTNSGGVGIGKTPVQGVALDVNGSVQISRWLFLPNGRIDVNAGDGDIFAIRANGKKNSAIIANSEDHSALAAFSQSSIAIEVLAESDNAVNARSNNKTGINSSSFSQTATESGVRGQCDNCQGVTGISSSHMGLVGIANATTGVQYGVVSNAYSPDGYAIYGYNLNPAGWSGYFNGKTHVNGTLSKSLGTFLIDHPLDPANKYLRHSFVESPDMMNIYNGIVTLKQNGEATVELPPYFVALNRDFRYSLTCIGSFAPVFIAEEIRDNRFRIAGGKPRMRISWQVTGIRQDAYAKTHPVIPESEKPAKERGKYLHPIEHGVAESLGVDYGSHQLMHEGMRASISRMNERKAQPSSDFFDQSK